jgi:hypothetical protein
VFTRKSISLIAVLTALGVLGISATSAWATKVTPSNTPQTATLAPGALAEFKPNNAFNPFWTVCEESEAKFTTPNNAVVESNINRETVGTFSSGPGSVTANLTQPPTFKKCSVVFEGAPVAGAEATTNANNGNWSVAMEGLGTTGGIVGIGVPKEGAEITVPGTECRITVSPDQSSVVMSRYTNATSSLLVDGQIALKENAPKCEEVVGVPFISPAQFEAHYTVAGGLTIEE